MAKLHTAMGELYPAGQPFAPNLTVLIGRAAHWADTKEEVEAQKAAIEAALKEVDAKLVGLGKLAQDRLGLRIDIDTHKSDIANFEKQGAPAAPKLEASKGKLAASTAAFTEIDNAIKPQLDALDAELAQLTGAAFRSFIEAQVKYNQGIAEHYSISLDSAAAEGAAAAAAAAGARAKAQAQEQAQEVEGAAWSSIFGTRRARSALPACTRATTTRRTPASSSSM